MYVKVVIHFVTFEQINFRFQGSEQQPDHGLATKRVQQLDQASHPHRQLQQVAVHPGETFLVDLQSRKSNREIVFSDCTKIVEMKWLSKYAFLGLFLSLLMAFQINKINS